ncbi:hypothetical protein ATY27_11255 [Rheinheimera sp. F8]|nr:hypothetical protein ATY27_05690 [Rheinheimera sp. F8]ALZ76277.1 hypothetical protein ATY27_11255 [Rheinheimera sp. F8]
MDGMAKMQEQFSANIQGWYAETGISKGQQFGLLPVERHLLCNRLGKMQLRGTQSFSAIVHEKRADAPSRRQWNKSAVQST